LIHFIEDNKLPEDYLHTKLLDSDISHYDTYYLFFKNTSNVRLRTLSFSL